MHNILLHLTVWKGIPSLILGFPKISIKSRFTVIIPSKVSERSIWFGTCIFPYWVTLGNKIYHFFLKGLITTKGEKGKAVFKPSLLSGFHITLLSLFQKRIDYDVEDIEGESRVLWLVMSKSLLIVWDRFRSAGNRAEHAVWPCIFFSLFCWHVGIGTK